ncbi:MAG: SDR family NAD(P)-dependent oxidoreductase [Acidimicrobiales bacterium]
MTGDAVDSGDRVDFGGDVVLVTGAGSGLGRAYSRLLAARGARVVVNDLGTGPDGRGRDGSVAEQVVAEIVAAGGEAAADGHSVADPAGAEGAVATAIERYGRLDAVVNNAGIVRYGGFHRMRPDDVEAVLDVHLRGSALVTRASWPHLAAGGHGRVVLTSSSIGLLGTPGQAAYGAAKAALAGMTRALAAAGAGRGIRVNALAPMAVTRLNEEVMAEIFGTEARRLTPELVAPVAAYLAHRDCRLNGEVLSAAGGRVARFALGHRVAGRGLRTPEQVGEALETVADRPLRWWSDPAAEEEEEVSGAR